MVKGKSAVATNTQTYKTKPTVKRGPIHNLQPKKPHIHYDSTQKKVWDRMTASHYCTKNASPFVIKQNEETTSIQIAKARLHLAMDLYEKAVAKEYEQDPAIREEENHQVTPRFMSSSSSSSESEFN